MGKNDILYELVKEAKITSIQAQKLLEKNNWSLNDAMADFRANGAPMEEASSINSSNTNKMVSLSDYMREGAVKKKTHYTGGEKSGMAVQDPDSDDDGDGDDLNGMFADANPLARNLIANARKVSKEEMESASSSKSRKGYSLKEDGPGKEAEEEKERTIVITLWKDGFSLDDGELRDYNTPENKLFMEQLNSGRVPNSLGVKFNERVAFHVMTKTTENYVAPPKKFKAFSGTGHKLGGVVPEVAQSATTTATTTASSSSTSSAPKPPVIDASKPTTSIQVRFVDGSKIVAKLNQDHLVKDIITFIQSAKPSEIGKSFVLETTLPKRRISDLNQNLKEAGLINVAVVQVYI